MTTKTRPTTRTALAAIAILATLGGAATAQTQADQDHSAHHPEGATAQTAPTPAPTPAVPPRGSGMGGGTPGMMMPGPGGQQGGAPGMMGGDMQRMMQMMHQRMAAQGAMRPLQRIEGQLAYFRTELRITEAQAPQWNTFADAVRAAADKLRQAMIQQNMPATGQAATAPALLERRIASLSLQLETTRAIAAAAGPLYAALSDEQKRTADELMAEHLRDMRRAGL